MIHRPHVLLLKGGTSRSLLNRADALAFHPYPPRSLNSFLILRGVFPIIECISNPRILVYSSGEGLLRQNEVLKETGSGRYLTVRLVRNQQ